ncbi:oligodendrocyte transcription factor 1 [Protopterus annectens]|uniref:oligodendrocyte transcription factor 1 n=1 Tax=Protopterus annectens TaxID=7888 RepID=UPI001CF9A8AF|nr:oligodendrocyte transcription factor 1 [Protopterus annectens]
MNNRLNLQSGHTELILTSHVCQMLPQTAYYKEQPSCSKNPKEVSVSHVNIQGSIRSKNILTEDQQQEQRRKINSRERKRMQDLNLAMDALRDVIGPYSTTVHYQNLPGRKLSKMATLLLARNYILLLNSSLREMRRALAELSDSGHTMLLTGLPLLTTPATVLLTHSSLSHPEGIIATKYFTFSPDDQQYQRFIFPRRFVCACATCKLSNAVPSNLTLTAVQTRLPK